MIDKIEGFEIFTKILEIQGMYQLEPKFIDDNGILVSIQVI